MHEKFGVGPEKVIEVQALAGDSSDNVPGVAGIGVKTAAQLITEYGDLETLLARAEEIKQPKRRENLIEHAELARISRRLVTLCTDVPVPEPLESFAVRLPEADSVLGFLEEQGFKSLLGKWQSRLGAAADAGATAPEAPPAFAQPKPWLRWLAVAAFAAAWGGCWKSCAPNGGQRSPSVSAWGSIPCSR